VLSWKQEDQEGYRRISAPSISQRPDSRKDSPYVHLEERWNYSIDIICFDDVVVCEDEVCGDAGGNLGNVLDETRARTGGSGSRVGINRACEMFAKIGGSWRVGPA
jgi:hypothetical protein